MDFPNIFPSGMLVTVTPTHNTVGSAGPAAHRIFFRHHMPNVPSKFLNFSLAVEDEEEKNSREITYGLHT
jgi:hypothetical protein